MLATAISVPLLLVGVYIASVSEHTPQDTGRPHGLLQPPVSLVPLHPLYAICHVSFHCPPNL